MQAEQSRIPHQMDSPRIITPKNVMRFIKALSKDDFKRFHSWRPELEKLWEEYLELEASDELPITYDEQMEEREDDKNNVANDLDKISSEMKKSNPKLYQKLTRLVFDDAPKSEIFQNVKVRRALVNQLRAQPEQGKLTTERLVELALTAYLDSLKSAAVIDESKESLHLNGMR